MHFSSPLIEGRLLRRYKRFLADVTVGGETLVAHCPNTGSMLGCVTPGNRVWLGSSDNPKRKYRHTLELIEVGDTLVGIHTGRSNGLVEEAIAEGRLRELAGCREWRREVAYGTEGSRIDLLATDATGRRCYVEVKNVTAAVADGVALFPDAVSERGTKHLRELMRIVAAGERAMVCFCVQRADVHEVRPADAIDPAYGATLRQAIAAGVEVVAYGARVSPEAIRLERALPVVCP